MSNKEKMWESLETNVQKFDNGALKIIYNSDRFCMIVAPHHSTTLCNDWFQMIFFPMTPL
jgi:hypothetical protein